MPLMLLQRKKIQQPLRRMCMSPIASIDDNRMLNYLSRIFSRPFCLMTHNDCIEAHSLYCQQSITKALALDNATSARSYIYNISTQIFPRCLKGCTGTCARFIKYSYD